MQKFYPPKTGEITEDIMSLAAERQRLYGRPDGEIRAASIDMDLESRAHRTMNFRQLNLTELTLVHEAEQKMLWFILPWQVRRVIGREYQTYSISKQKIEYLKQVCLENKPKNVPPPGHPRHDGMNYHQAWDFSTRDVVLKFPSEEKKEIEDLVLE